MVCTQSKPVSIENSVFAEVKNFSPIKCRNWSTSTGTYFWSCGGYGVLRMQLILRLHHESVFSCKHFNSMSSHVDPVDPTLSHIPVRTPCFTSLLYSLPSLRPGYVWDLEDLPFIYQECSFIYIDFTRHLIRLNVWSHDNCNVYPFYDARCMHRTKREDTCT